MSTDLAIIFFIFLSYFFGLKSIFDNRYRPNVYSRIIWFILVLNNFISVLLLNNNFSVLILAGLGLVGNFLILVLSLNKSERKFGKTEIISSVLIFLSLCLWIFTKLPFLNLTIGLIAHLIGGIPTFRQVIRKPREEDLFFWLFFFLGSIIALANTDLSSVSQYMYPLYFALLNGVMTLLCLRRYKILR